MPRGWRVVDPVATTQAGPLEALDHQQQEGPLEALDHRQQEGPLEALDHRQQEGPLEALDHRQQEGPLEAPGQQAPGAVLEQVAPQGPLALGVAAELPHSPSASPTRSVARATSATPVLRTACLSRARLAELRRPAQPGFARTGNAPLTASSAESATTFRSALLTVFLRATKITA
jgi:hypothetical protein